MSIEHPSAPSEAFRSNLVSFRELRGLTQAELGRKASIAAASISHFETGQRVPSLDSLVKLANALEIPVDTLLGRAPVDSIGQIDPLFLRASKADARTLDMVKRIL